MAKQTKRVMLCTLPIPWWVMLLEKRDQGLKQQVECGVLWLHAHSLVCQWSQASCACHAQRGVVLRCTMCTWHHIALILGIRRRWCNTSPLCTSTLLATAWSSYCTLRLGIPTPNQVPDAILGGVRWSFGAKQCRHQYVSFHLLASPTYNINNGP